jgi:hypothetical protein
MPAHTDVPLQLAAWPGTEEFRTALICADKIYLAAGCSSMRVAGSLIGLAFSPYQDLSQLDH